VPLHRRLSAKQRPEVVSIEFGAINLLQPSCIRVPREISKFAFPLRLHTLRADDCTFSMRNLQTKLSIARGEQPAESLFKNAKLVNVLSGEVYPTHVAVDDGRVIGLGDYEAKRVIDLQGAYLAPSLIDAHFHVESSMLTAPEFAR